MKIDPQACPTKPPSMILYDWDNTLAESWPAILVGMNAAFRAHDMEEWTLDELKQRARLSMRDGFPKIFGEDRWEAARDVFYTAFEAVHIDQLVPLDGAEALVSDVHRRGIPQSVVSNKQGNYIRAEAAHMNWTTYFHALIGAGDAERDKPDPAPISLAMEGIGFGPSLDVWFVGDAYVDVSIARNAGLTSILIHPDPESSDEFNDFPPDAYFTNLVEFSSFLKAL